MENKKCLKPPTSSVLPPKNWWCILLFPIKMTRIADPTLQGPLTAQSSCNRCDPGARSCPSWATKLPPPACRRWMKNEENGRSNIFCKRYVYIYIYQFLNVHPSLCIHITLICIYIYVCIHMYTYICINVLFIYLYTSIAKCSFFMHTYNLNMYLSIYIYVLIHMYTYICIHTYVYTHMYTYI